MSSCNTNTTCCSTASCSSSSCSSCKCCHVQNVTIDNQLCVGNETQLRTCTSDGGALIVQNGCCTQTSGVLAHICGESGQVAFKTENGKVQMDPNDDLADDTIGVSIYNSATQTTGELVKIRGEPEQIALKVAKGETHLIPYSDTGNALYISNEAIQKTDELVLIDGITGGQEGGVLLKVDGVSNQTALAVNRGQTELDPYSVSGGALYITNTEDQSGGELVSIEGTADEIALKVSEGQTELNPNSISGGALYITNTEDQSGGELVSIEGTSGQVALQVSEGQTELDPNSETGGALVITNSNATQTSGQLVNITGTAGQVALQVDEGVTILDSNSSTGEALIITSTEQQTSGILTHIDGTATQMALQVDNGNVQLAHVASADAVLTGGSIDSTPIGSNDASTGAFTSLSVIGTTSNSTVNITPYLEVWDYNVNQTTNGIKLINSVDTYGLEIFIDENGTYHTELLNNIGGTGNDKTNIGLQFADSTNSNTVIAQYTGDSDDWGYLQDNEDYFGFYFTVTALDTTNDWIFPSSNPIPSVYSGQYPPTTHTELHDYFQSLWDGNQSSTSLVVKPYTIQQTSSAIISISGLQVVGAQQSAVADASQSIPADGAISTSYEQAEVEQLRDAVAELQTQVNSLLAKLRAHGLLAT